MNNNYHTQMDKQNILNEVAANNNLLQQQMQHYQGTPINKPHTIPQAVTQPLPMQQLTPQQIMYTQMLQQQQNHRVGSSDAGQIFTTIPQQQELQQLQQLQQSSNDEIELSDTKPNENPMADSKVNDNQNQQINKQIQQVLQNNNNDQVNFNKVQQLPKKMQTAALPMQPLLRYPPQQLPPPQLPAPAPAKSCKPSKLTDYIIIPVIILVAFVLLMHPSTSKYLSKYLPDATNTKGILMRGVILVIIYVVARFITNMTGK